MSSALSARLVPETEAGWLRKAAATSEAAYNEAEYLRLLLESDHLPIHTAELKPFALVAALVSLLGLSFADGHAEIKKWVHKDTKPPLKPGVIIPYDRPSPNNPDVYWMQERATRAR